MIEADALSDSGLAGLLRGRFVRSLFARRERVVPPPGVAFPGMKLHRVRRWGASRDPQIVNTSELVVMTSSQVLRDEVVGAVSVPPAPPSPYSVELHAGAQTPTKRRTATPKTRIRLPVGLLDLIDANPPPGWARPGPRARYLALLADLFDPDFKSREGWRSLPVVNLRQRYSSGAVDGVPVHWGPQLIEHLISLKVLRVDRRYSAARHVCRKYKVREGWYRRPRVTIDLPSSLVYTPPPATRAVDMADDPTLDALADCLAFLVYDTGAAYASLCGAPEPVSYVEASRRLARRLDDLGARVVGKRQAYLNVALRTFEHGDRWCYRDGTSLRVHHHITNLPSSLRRFVGFVGEDAVAAIDVRNSQLLLPCAVLLKTATPDVIDWYDISRSGQAYETVFEVVEGRPPSPRERSAFKRLFFRAVWFSTPATALSTDLGKALAAHWPTVFALLLELKSEDYRAFPVLMQRLESELVCGTAAMELYAQDIPVVTIHDSLMVPARHEEAARQALRRAFARAGLEPDLHTEIWPTPFAAR